LQLDRKIKVKVASDVEQIYPFVDTESRTKNALFFSFLLQVHQHKKEKENHLQEKSTTHSAHPPVQKRYFCELRLTRGSSE
jgi:hypothetical protein